MILITFPLRGKKSGPEFSSEKIPLKIEGAWKKPTTPAQLF
jgi:hypothetical protein